MKLIQQQSARTQTEGAVVQYKKQKQDTRILPFNRFKRSVEISIFVHFARFALVSAIYYWSDKFLIQIENKSSEPWNSLLYFLAMMIEIIKFIGDCSLRNLLNRQHHKIVEINRSINNFQTDHSQNTNPPLKGAKYQDYMSVFSMVRVFKFKHKNYSSGYSISKYMHIICTFCIFGWRSLKEQSKQEINFVQLLTLIIFLLSIYFTSFEIDYYLIETSMGKYMQKTKRNLQDLTQNQKIIIQTNFIKWRQSYILIQHIGTFFLIIGLLLQFQLTILTFITLIVIFVNFFGWLIQRKIASKISHVLNSMKRQDINTYSILNRVTNKFNKIFHFYILQFLLQNRFQRVSFFIFWCFLARYQFIEIKKPIIYLVGLLALVLSQKKKFEIGNKLKLMSISQIQFSNQKATNQQRSTQCAICLKFILLKQKVKVLPCSKEHIYHSQCFQDWKRYKNECPLCRFQLDDYI